MPKQKCIHGFEDGCIRCLELGPAAPIQLTVILDKSASMAGAWPQTIEGLNEYFQSLRQDKNAVYSITMVEFDTNHRVLHNQVGLDSIPKFGEGDIVPDGGSTALFDAVGETVSQIDANNSVDHFLVVVVTDGANNSSKIWDKNKVSKLIAEREKLGNYMFTYLGADKAAWSGNANLGVARGATANFAASNRMQAFAGLAAGTRGYSANIFRKSNKLYAEEASNQAPDALLSANFYGDAGVEDDEAKAEKAKTNMGTGKK